MDSAAADNTLAPLRERIGAVAKVYSIRILCVCVLMRRVLDFTLALDGGALLCCIVVASSWRLRSLKFQVFRFSM